MNLDVEGIPVLVRGKPAEAAVYCGNGDWIFLAGQIDGRTWEAWVTGYHISGTAPTVEAADRSVARFWLKHRDDSVTGMTDHSRPMWQTDTGPSQARDGIGKPRLTQEDFDLVRNWGKGAEVGHG